MRKLMWIILNILSLSFGFDVIAAPLPTKKIEVISNYPLPADVITAVQQADLRFGESISGRRIFDTNIIRTQQLTIAKKSALVFRLDPSQPKPDFLVLAAQNVSIEGPQTDSDVATITYELSGNVDGQFPGNGRDGNRGPVSGARGGNGENGPDGKSGNFYDLPPVYILFQNIDIRGGNPNSSRILQVNFTGVRGGNGSNGGNGGRGGDGAQGKDAVCAPWCTAGAGKGGDSGTPGIGGIGGDGARGGNGADIHYFTQTTFAPIMRFFIAAPYGGGPGVGGSGGYCGAVGQEGGGGQRNCCFDTPGSGNKTLCPGLPQSAVGSSSKQQGLDGKFSITEKDLSILF